ncbi:MAG: response regulator transcription factor [Chloroflexi bacterium]|nr:response regulator transcription factor [Chloroflexota bacterium]
MEAENIRVLIADDHGVVRAGLRGLLEDSGLNVVGEACNGRQAVELVKKEQPDVLLLDIRMPDMDGLQALSAIKAAHPQTSVIMLTTYANPEYLARAVSLGAAGYLRKEVDPHCIPKAVRTAVSGDTLLDRDLLQAALAQQSPPPSIPVPETASAIPHEADELTDQENIVLQLIVDGLNNDAIARALSISRSTVKTHVSHIFKKLYVSDRTQAAVWAMRHGVTA